MSRSELRKKRHAIHDEGDHILDEDLRPIPDEDVHRTLETLDDDLPRHLDDAKDDVKGFSLTEEDARPTTGVINGFLLGVALLLAVLVIVFIVRMA